MKMSQKETLKLFIYFIVFLIFLSVIIYLITPKYTIFSSNKANCDILLNTHTGQTWFNCDGYWQKSSKDFTR